MDDTQAFLRQLTKRGYVVTLAGSGHYHIRRNGRLAAVTSKTPHGGKRALNNLRSQIRRFERSKQDAPKTQ